jgi:hypothetical protein
MLLRRVSALALSIAFSGGIAHAEAPHQLTGWAVLPSTARTPGPTSGQFITPSLGVTPPFVAEQPIPGWSGLLLNDDGTFTALPDNGFGSKANSADYVLGFYNVSVSFKTASDGTSNPGSIANNSFTAFNDKNRILANGAGVDLLITADLVNYRTGNGFGSNSGIPVDPAIVAGRLLTGYDFDVESIAKGADGSYWVGEEFGPYVLHFAADGTLLDEPIPHPFLKSPANPAVIAQPGTQTLASSRGFESLALNATGDRLYAVPEGAPTVDALRAVSGDERVVEIFEIDPAAKAYTGVTYKYRKEGTVTGNAIVIGDMTNVGGNKYVLIERDSLLGVNAVVKRLYLIDFGVVDADGILVKTLLVDLLHISDPLDIAGDLAGAPGPDEFSMPFDSIESVRQIDEYTLAVAIDTNYPTEDGRVPGSPDNTEIITLEFAEPLAGEPVVVPEEPPVEEPPVEEPPVEEPAPSE